ncbi:hypothetical protein Clacol_002933 [Clathrus columnatus]|uniref:FAD-binding domain-containing protein n=1 Tax=Clathrus columnatus TaxID=1419009 RepID=A0AAV5A245_9AGAM|nr:hypothetical protein Clacol_002933 [Clathrus columnatus]
MSNGVQVPVVDASSMDCKRKNILQGKSEVHDLHEQRGKKTTGIKKLHDDGKVEFLFAGNTTIVTKSVIGADGAHSVVSFFDEKDFNDPDGFQIALGRRVLRGTPPGNWNSHILLIDDAAHVHSLLDGQGMNLNICDAISPAHFIHAHMGLGGLRRDTIIIACGKKRHEAGEPVMGLTMTITRVLH